MLSLVFHIMGTVMITRINWDGVLDNSQIVLISG